MNALAHVQRLQAEEDEDFDFDDEYLDEEEASECLSARSYSTLLFSISKAFQKGSQSAG